MRTKHASAFLTSFRSAISCQLENRCSEIEAIRTGFFVRAALRIAEPRMAQIHLLVFESEVFQVKLNYHKVSGFLALWGIGFKEAQKEAFC